MAADRLTELYRAYGPVIYARCRRLLGDGAAAEDATQETFMRVHRHLDKADSREALAWIYRIATNYCLNEIRNAKLRPELRDELPEVIDLDVLTAGNGVARETQVLATVGRSLSMGVSHFSVWAGPHLGLGATFQSSRTTASTGAVAAGLAAGFGVRITQSVGLEAIVQMTGQLLIVDGDPALRSLPSLWFGTVITP